MKIEIDVNDLAAMKLFMAKQDVRYYLNGLLLEIGSLESRLVATNGCMMAVMRLYCRRPGPTQRVIIPSEALAGVKPAKLAEVATITIDGTADVADLNVETEKWEWSGKSIDGHYPDYVRVLPRTVSGELAQFDGKFLYAFQQAAEILSRGKYPVVGHNGTGAALVSIGGRDDFLGAIMPLRTDWPPTEAPTWAGQSIEAAQVAA